MAKLKLRVNVVTAEQFDNIQKNATETQNVRVIPNTVTLRRGILADPEWTLDILKERVLAECLNELNFTADPISIIDGSFCSWSGTCPVGDVLDSGLECFLVVKNQKFNPVDITEEPSLVSDLKSDHDTDSHTFVADHSSKQEYPPTHNSVNPPTVNDDSPAPPQLSEDSKPEISGAELNDASLAGSEDMHTHSSSAPSSAPTLDTNDDTAGTRLRHYYHRFIFRRKLKPLRKCYRSHKSRFSNEKLISGRQLRRIGVAPKLEDFKKSDLKRKKESKPKPKPKPKPKSNKSPVWGVKESTDYLQGNQPLPSHIPPPVMPYSLQEVNGDDAREREVRESKDEGNGGGVNEVIESDYEDPNFVPIEFSHSASSVLERRSRRSSRESQRETHFQGSLENDGLPGRRILVPDDRDGDIAQTHASHKEDENLLSSVLNQSLPSKSNYHPDLQGGEPGEHKGTSKPGSNRRRSSSRNMETSAVSLVLAAKSLERLNRSLGLPLGQETVSPTSSVVEDSLRTSSKSSSGHRDSVLNTRNVLLGPASSTSASDQNSILNPTQSQTQSQPGSQSQLTHRRFSDHHQLVSHNEPDHLNNAVAYRGSSVEQTPIPGHISPNVRVNHNINMNMVNNHVRASSNDFMNSPRLEEGERPSIPNQFDYNPGGAVLFSSPASIHSQMNPIPVPATTQRSNSVSGAGFEMSGMPIASGYSSMQPRKRFASSGAYGATPVGQLISTPISSLQNEITLPGGFSMLGVETGRPNSVPQTGVNNSLLETPVILDEGNNSSLPESQQQLQQQPPPPNQPQYENPSPQYMQGTTGSINDQPQPDIPQSLLSGSQNTTNTITSGSNVSSYPTSTGQHPSSSTNGTQPTSTRRTGAEQTSDQKIGSSTGFSPSLNHLTPPLETILLSQKEKPSSNQESSQALPPHGLNQSSINTPDYQPEAEKNVSVSADSSQHMNVQSQRSYFDMKKQHVSNLEPKKKTALTQFKESSIRDEFSGEHTARKPNTRGILKLARTTNNSNFSNMPGIYSFDDICSAKADQNRYLR